MHWVDVGANRLRLLRDGAQAVPAMLESIAQAVSEVLVEMYWVGPDSVGRRILHALTRRARAGVRVFVVYDSVGSLSLDDAFWNPLREAGGQVEEFHPLSPLKRRFEWSRLGMRDHRKILVVDGKDAYVGGLNFADPWLPFSEGGEGWRDDVIQVLGPLAEELRSVFFDTWRKIGGSVPLDVQPITRKPAARAFALINRTWTKPDRAIRRAHLFAFRKARESVRISHAYFVPDPLVLRSIGGAARRGVDVHLLLPEQSDVFPIALVSKSLVGRLLKSGVRVSLYQPRVLHTKTMIVDERFVISGSFNLDSRSWRNNLECSIGVNDEGFARCMVQSFEADVSLARPMDLDAWEARPLLERAVGRLASIPRSLW